MKRSKVSLSSRVRYRPDWKIVECRTVLSCSTITLVEPILHDIDRWNQRSNQHQNRRNEQDDRQLLESLG